MKRAAIPIMLCALAIVPGGRGASALDGVEVRTYRFEPTGEEMEWALFVSSRVDPKEPSPSVIALQGRSVSPASILRGRVVESADALVGVDVSRRLAAHMDSLEMTYEYFEIPGGSHPDAMGIGAPFVFDFFDRHVKADSAPDDTDVP